MAREVQRLSATDIKTLPTGKYADGGGLWLVKADNASGKWVLRVSIAGRRREMGLGSIHQVKLAEAREAARKAQNLARDGIDPVKERQARRRLAAARAPLFKDVLDRAFEAKKADLKGEGQNGRWMSPLAVHVLPKLGNIDVERIDQTDIRDCLKPIWHKHASVAAKAMNRIGIVLKHAAAEGHDVDLQAVMKARALLGKQKHEATSIPALAWKDVPAFYQSLTNDMNIGALALRMVILTAARPGEVRGLRPEELDSTDRIWTVPGSRMKGGTEHRVPLSDEAMAVIQQAMAFEKNGYLFPGRAKKADTISDMTLTQIMKRRGMLERPHGFRSSFRTWLDEATDTRFEVAEACLSHVVGTKVSRAYARSDFIEERTALMQRWADYVCG